MIKSTTTLQKIIEEIKSDPAIRNKDDDMVILREICNKIQSEEDAKLAEHDLTYLKDSGPNGAVVLLTVYVPFQRHPKETCYLTIENDPLTGLSVCHYVDFGKTGQNKLRKRHDIDSTNPNHIMTHFAKIYKAYLGKETTTI
jgi:hypothetical protein